MKRRKEKVRLPLHDFFVSKSRTSSIQEIRIRDDVKGKRASVAESNDRAASAVVQDRHDVENAKFVIEAKQTVKSRYSVTHKVLVKVDKQAANRHKMPALVVEFKEMPFGTERSWAVLPFGVIDSMDRGFMVVPKTTDKRSFALTESLLSKVDKDAVVRGVVPLIVIEFQTMRFGVTGKWIVVPYSVFVKLARGE